MPPKNDNGQPAAESSSGLDAGNEIGNEIMNEVAGHLGGPEIKEETETEETETTEETDTEETETTAETTKDSTEESTETEETTEETEEKEKDNENEKESEDSDDKAAKIDTTKEVATALKDLPEETRTRVQGVVDKIVGRVVGRERAEKERLGTRVEELTSELSTANASKGPVQIAGVNPLMLLENEAALSEHEAKLEKFIDWADDNAAGVNLPDSEGYDETKPTFTADEIRKRKREVLREQSKIVPQARANLQQRATIEKNLRAVYPAAYDPKAPEYAAIERVLKALPEIRQFADARVLALKQYLGDRALAELIEQRKEQKPTGQQKQQPKEQPAKKKVPRAPGAGSPAKGSVLAHKSNKPAASEAVSKVMKDPGNKGAFEDAVSSLIGNDLD